MGYIAWLAHATASSKHADSSQQQQRSPLACKSITHSEHSGKRQHSASNAPAGIIQYPPRTPSVDDCGLISSTWICQVQSLSSWTHTVYRSVSVANEQQATLLKTPEVLLCHWEDHTHGVLMAHLRSP